MVSTAKWFDFSFDHKQRVVANDNRHEAYRHDIRCKRHWPAQLENGHVIEQGGEIEERMATDSLSVLREKWQKLRFLFLLFTLLYFFLLFFLFIYIYFLFYLFIFYFILFFYYYFLFFKIFFIIFLNNYNSYPIVWSKRNSFKLFNGI